MALSGRSVRFYAGAADLIVREVQRRYLTGVIDAAEDWATFPYGTDDEALDTLTHAVVNRPFSRCIGPSLVEPTLRAVVATLHAEFPEAFATFSDERIQRLAGEMGKPTEDGIDVPGLLAVSLTHLRSVCRTYLEDRVDYGIDVVFVRLDPGFEPLIA